MKRMALLGCAAGLLMLVSSACVPAGGLTEDVSWSLGAADTAPLPTARAAGAAQVASEWTQLGGNPQRTGYVADAVPAPWRVAWIWNGPPLGGDGGPGAGHLRLPKGVQPVSGGGRLYVGHSDGTVIAINRASGAEAWRRNVGGPVVNTAAYDEQTDSVYLGTTDGRLVRLRGSDGQQLATFSLSGEVLAAPLLVGQRVFACSTTGALHSLDKATLSQEWIYQAGAALIGSPAYSASYGGLVIVLAEDKSVHAVHVGNGTRRWRATVNADQDTRRGNTVFADTYPVVSDVNDVVIVRSYLDWNRTWTPDDGAPATVSEIRDFLTRNPTYQSLFVLELDTGTPRFMAPVPVMLGGIGNGGDYESVPPQAVVKRLNDGSEVAYVQWRTRQSCLPTRQCDGREDSTFGEMDLTTGDIRFVQSHKGDGTIRLPTDEQSPLSMGGDTLFLAHWMTMGAVRITDRSAGLGDTYANPIRTQEVVPTLNTLASGSCPGRDAAAHYCPVDMYAPSDGYRNDPGLYVYYASQRIYDQYWTTPVRSAIIVDGTVYWKTVDGAIVAIQSGAAPGDGEQTPTSPTPTGPPQQQETAFLPLVRRR